MWFMGSKELDMTERLNWTELRVWSIDGNHWFFFFFFWSRGSVSKSQFDLRIICPCRWTSSHWSNSLWSHLREQELLRGFSQEGWLWMTCKEIKPVSAKGNQLWIFIGRTDAETLILWPPDVKSRLIGKDPDAGKYWRQKEKGAAEDEMIR